MFNTARLIKISIFNKDYTYKIFICSIVLVLFILLIGFSVFSSYSNQTGGCNYAVFFNTATGIYWFFVKIFFYFDIFIYIFGAFIVLPILGIMMVKKVVEIHIDSNKLKNLKIKSNKSNIIDRKLVISHICVSNFAILFNLPFLFGLLLYPGNYLLDTQFLKINQFLRNIYSNKKQTCILKKIAVLLYRFIINKKINSLSDLKL